jgi:hypothetical protein
VSENETCSTGLFEGGGSTDEASVVDSLLESLVLISRKFQNQWPVNEKLLAAAITFDGSAVIKKFPRRYPKVDEI